MKDRVSPAESIAVHVALVLAVAVALYPVLWVVSLAFSGERTPTPQIIPIPSDPTLAHLRAVVGTTSPDGSWLFGRQLANSVIVSLATALVGVLIAIPAAYALARFELRQSPAFDPVLIQLPPNPDVSLTTRFAAGANVSACNLNG